MPPSPSISDPRYRALVEQEALIVDAQEMVCELLERANLSRQELAKALGKSKGFVSQLLSGERNMTLRTLADLAHAMGHRVELNVVPIDEPKRYGAPALPSIRFSEPPASAGDLYRTAFSPLHDHGAASGQGEVHPVCVAAGRLGSSRVRSRRPDARRQDWIRA